MDNRQQGYLSYLENVCRVFARQGSLVLMLIFTWSCLSAGQAVENQVVVNQTTVNKDQQQTLMIVGYDGSSWYPYIVSINDHNKIKYNSWKKIPGIRNPAYLTRQPGSGDFFIKSNNGELYRYQSAGKKLAPLFTLSSAAEFATNYTQLRAHKDGVVMVKLLEGKSRDTQLVSINSLTDNTSQRQAEPLIKPLLEQVSAQFHPLLYQHQLYYAHVSCRLVCDPLIMEVWRQDLNTGKARQMTLLNATTYLHSVDAEGSAGFISSNQQGYYHLAHLDLNTNKVTWLTQGQVTDSYPGIAHDGGLYFIRRTPTGTQLMLMEKKYLTAALSASNFTEKALKQIPLPKDVQKIRYLEITE